MLERLSIKKNEIRNKPWGIVLTAGSQKKHAPDFSHPWIDEDGETIYPWRYRIEPDLEGKMRSLAALQDLVNGEIQGILIAGGSRNHNIPLARIYTDFLHRFLNRYDLSPDQIVEVQGGVHTPSDLRKANKYLKEIGYAGDLIIYSSSYQFERRAIKKFVKNYQGGGD